MHLPATLLSFLVTLHLTTATSPLNHKREVAAGGGGPVAAPVATQFPTVSADAWELVVAGGVTKAVQRPFTQTFAATALGSWALGPTPAVGTVGLGNIKRDV